MLTFDSLLPADSVLTLGDYAPIIGTAMLGDAFGVVDNFQLVRTGEREEIKNDAGELRLLLLKNPGWVAMMKAFFDDDVEAPGLLEAITLPLIDITGRVMEGATVEWTKGGERMLSIPISSWDSMSGAAAYRLDASGTKRVIS